MSSVRANTYLDASGGSNAQLYGVSMRNGGTAWVNRIINGDMRIDQRNAGASVSTPPNYTLDRWKLRYSSNGGTAGTCTVQRSTTAPTGFTNSFLLTVGTARTVVSGDRFGLEQPIEGYNMADFGWGTANAQSVTLSFWVRSSLTGTFGLCFSNFSRGYAATYTISAANTWEYKTVTIVGDTSGTWDTTNGTGVLVVFDLGMGSDVRTTTGSWQAGTFLGATGATSVVGTNGATFYITGVQLEAGTVASAFERRDYGRELIMCQRYCQLNTAAMGKASTSAGAGAFYIPLQTPMRAAPTATLVTGTNRVDEIYVSQRTVSSVGSAFGNDTAGTAISYVLNVTSLGANSQCAVFGGTLLLASEL